MSLISNMTVYLNTKYNMSGIFVVNVVTIWNGSSNIASLAGAFLSDAYLGRFHTLLFGSIASLLVKIPSSVFIGSGLIRIF
jgi:dipeptide/tripeptide permease